MVRVSLSGTEKAIEDVWSWYEDQKDALRDFRNKILSGVINPSVKINDKFLALTLDELNDYFEKSFDELEHLVAFDLIAATEGNLRADFYRRVYDKDKSNLGREFRSIYKDYGNKISLEEHIIDRWKEHEVSAKSDFSNLLGLLHYRHWLAHGRYWTLNKTGRQYSVVETYGIADNIINNLPEA